MNYEEATMTTARRVALVTGASSGIGEAATLAVAEAGFEVIDPATVARVIVAAATDPKPKLRCTAGPTAGRASAPLRCRPGFRQTDPQAQPAGG